MQVDINSQINLEKTDNLFVLVCEGEAKPKVNVAADLQTKIKDAIAAGRFKGRLDEFLTVLSEQPRKITILGLGKRDLLTHRVVRQALDRLGSVAQRGSDSRIAVAFGYALPGLDDVETARWMADQIGQCDYRFDAYITVATDEKPRAIRCTYVPPASMDRKVARRLSTEASILSAAVGTVKNLGNGPGNEITPEEIGKRAIEIGKRAGFSCKVYDKKQIEKMKMGGLLAVNAGSDKEPRFIVMEYAPKKPRKTICLVGKGITFDSGGISIKPSDRMEEMKFDMCGAAAVVGTMEAVARLKLPHRVIGIVASTENLPSGSAYKPGDIITTMSGKTIEVVNTDAEGRMILSDALHYASMQKPDHIIDFATLTGACVVALGGEASGLFCNDDLLADGLIAAGRKTGERVWRLPEWDEYKDYIRSEWADMKNSGGRWAGAITAAVFLKEFVDCPSWAHLDIAGTAYAESRTPRDRKGATGVGVRTTVRFLESLD